MTITSTQLWQRIADSKLATQTECRQWASELLELSGPEGMHEPASILAHLIRSRRLTPYQANSLMETELPPLVIGPYRILSKVQNGLFDGWLEARPIDSKQTVCLFPLDQSKLIQNESWRKDPPSLRWARANAAVESPSFLHFGPPFSVDSTQYLIAFPLAMRKIQDLPVPWKQATQWIERLAEGLALLHQSGIVHGRIQPQAVGLNASSEPFWIRDPLFPPRSPLLPPTPRSLPDLPTSWPLKPVAFAAPEFLVPGQMPTPATDLYALGCLWFFWITGKPPFPAESDEHCMASHVRDPITFPKTLDIPDQIRKSLLHLCAKNPKARFSSANDLLAALGKPKVPTKVSPAATVVPASVVPVAPVPASPVPASPVPASPVPASTVPASTVPASTVPASTVPATPASATQTPTSAVTKPNLVKAESVKPESVKPTVVPELVKPIAVSPAMVPPTPLPKPKRPEEPKPIESKSVPSSPHTPPSKEKISIPPTDAKVATPSKPASVPEAASIAAVPNSAPDITKQPVAPVPPVAQAEMSKAASSDLTPQSKPPLSEKGGTKKDGTKKGVAKKKGSSTPRKRSKKSGRPKWLMPVVGGASFFSILAIVVMLTQNKPTPGERKNNQANAATNPETIRREPPVQPEVRDPLSDQFQLQADDGQLPWAPPRPASPYDLEMLPPGAQLLLFAKPERWMTSPVGREVMGVLDDTFSQVWKQWDAATGVVPAEAKEVAIAMYAGESGWPSMAFRVELQKPRLLGELKSLWRVTEEKKTPQGYSLFIAPDRTYFVMQAKAMDADAIQRFAFGPPKLMDEVAELEGGAGPLRRQLESLWQVSDAKADLGILMSPGFLFQDGKQILQKWAPRYESTLQKLIGSDIVGLSTSISVEPKFYGELRVMGNSEKETLKASQEIKSQFQSLADQAESMLVRQPAHLYWRAIANRLPQMLRTMKQYQRFGVEQGHAVSNLYLPSEALPNLAMATWMTMQEGGLTSPSIAAAPVVSNPVDSKRLSVEEILGRPIDMVFDQQSLETAMNSIAEEINNGLPPGNDRLLFEIDGDAFEKDGITRNKEVRNFQFRKEPGRNALNDLARKANPESAPALNSPIQKVVWVIVDDPKSPGKKKILFTTRKVIEANKIEVPKEFALPSQPGT